MGRTTMLGAVVGLAMAALGGCEAADRIDSRIDCRHICTRYAECFDESYDVGGCMDDCRDSAASDEQYEAKVDACENCIDDESCASATFSCADDCAGVVP